MQARRLDELMVSAIVPAYNEAGNILNVLDALQGTPAVREIIVVSDGSTDGTAQVAAAVGGVRVVELAENVGKTKAVLRGVEEAAQPVILLIDADLVNLTRSHVADMIRKYCEGWDMVIMDKGGQSWVFRHLLQSLPAESGTRMLERRHLQAVPFRAGDRFQFENRINNHFLQQGLGIAVSPAETVYDPRKFVKYPFWRGLWLDLCGGWQVMTADGVWNILGTLRTFRRLHKLAEETGAFPVD